MYNQQQTMWKKRHLERFRNSVVLDHCHNAQENKLQTLTARNISCNEVLVTDRVARVEVERCSFEDFIKKSDKTDRVARVEIERCCFEDFLKQSDQNIKKSSCSTNRKKTKFNGAFKSSNNIKRSKNSAKTNRLNHRSDKLKRTLRSNFLKLSKRIPKTNKKYLDFIVSRNNSLVAKSPKSILTRKIVNSNLKTQSLSNIHKTHPLTNNYKIQPLANDHKTQLLTNNHKTKPLIKPNNKENIMEKTSLADSSSDTVYFLNVNLSRCGRPRKLKRDVEFATIAKSLKEVKLPGDEWKIEIRLKNKVVNQIVFVNRRFERSVNFYRIHNTVDIMFGDVRVSLIGAPRMLESIDDVSILLDIVHCIDPNDPIVKCENEKFP